VRILFDHNVPKRFRQFLGEYEVRTAREMGWAELENGDLLRQAESAGFDLMLTGDKNLGYQQNLKGRRLALIVLGSNNWNILRESPVPVRDAVARATPGSFEVVRFAG
jgi:hypothetical protein